MWFITNLIGINLMPTLIIFIALTPLYFALVTTGRPVYFAIPGFIVCIAAVTIQAISDRHMDLFEKDPSNEGKHIDCGLWKYSRHPNYLGEISFWWGIWLMQVWLNPSAWWTVTGPVLMTLLFLFVSIPLMERHILETRPGYRKYQRKVPVMRLFPLESNDNKARRHVEKHDYKDRSCSNSHRERSGDNRQHRLRQCRFYRGKCI
jgi:steroid 5-alpha reductase family enzyme